MEKRKGKKQSSPKKHAALFFHLQFCYSFLEQKKKERVIHIRRMSTNKKKCSLPTKKLIYLCQILHQFFTDTTELLVLFLANLSAAKQRRVANLEEGVKVPELSI